MDVYEGLRLAKTARAADKLARRQGFKLRYTVELVENDPIERVKAHLDADAAREYIASRPCAYLLPTELFDRRTAKLAECARERFLLGVCDRFDT